MTPLEELEAAERALEAARRRVAAATCAEVGHRWKQNGGKNAGCDRDGCACSVPVYDCEVCHDCDYGENAEAIEIVEACRRKSAELHGEG